MKSNNNQVNISYHYFENKSESEPQVKDLTNEEEWDSIADSMMHIKHKKTKPGKYYIII